MTAYATRVKRDIERWAETGFVDAATARVLASDIESRQGGGFSFATALSMMAAALFSAALLIFIAANWEEIPRIMRVAMLSCLIVGGYVGGAVLKLRGNAAFGEAAWIVAAAAFGASIALIGQMYHLSGDEKQAVFVWGAGTAFAAAALRSGPLTVGAAVLAIGWMILLVSVSWPPDDLPVTYLLVAAVLYGLSFWTDSRTARHVLIQSLVLFGLLHFLRDEALTVPVLVAAFSAALFLIHYLYPAQAERALGLGNSLSLHALIGFLAGMGIVQLEFLDQPGLLMPTIVAFAGIILALLLAGRDNPWLRRVAYAAFIFQLCFIYVVMLGSMLGTAGFFLLGGVALSMLAWFITRLERRFAAVALSAPGGRS